MTTTTTQVEQELRKVVAGEIRFDPYSRALYSTDASNYQTEPLGSHQVLKQATCHVNSGLLS